MWDAFRASRGESRYEEIKEIISDDILAVAKEATKRGWTDVIVYLYLDLETPLPLAKIIQEFTDYLPGVGGAEGALVSGGESGLSGERWDQYTAPRRKTLAYLARLVKFSRWDGRNYTIVTKYIVPYRLYHYE
ncbi:MAG: hypothetical protein ACYCQJ_14850 [Nitrososphaerales archaeon]